MDPITLTIALTFMLWRASQAGAEAAAQTVSAGRTRAANRVRAAYKTRSAAASSPAAKTLFAVLGATGTALVETGKGLGLVASALNAAQAAGVQAGRKGWAEGRDRRQQAQEHRRMRAEAEQMNRDFDEQEAREEAAAAEQRAADDLDQAWQDARQVSSEPEPAPVAEPARPGPDESYWRRRQPQEDLGGDVRPRDHLPADDWDLGLDGGPAGPPSRPDPDPFHFRLDEPADPEATAERPAAPEPAGLDQGTPETSGPPAGDHTTVGEPVSGSLTTTGRTGGEITDYAAALRVYRAWRDGAVAIRNAIDRYLAEAQAVGLPAEDMAAGAALREAVGQMLAHIQAGLDRFEGIHAVICQIVTSGNLAQAGAYYDPNKGGSGGSVLANGTATPALAGGR